MSFAWPGNSIRWVTSVTIGSIPNPFNTAARCVERVVAQTNSPCASHRRATRRPKYPQPQINFAIRHNPYNQTRSPFVGQKLVNGFLYTVSFRGFLSADFRAAATARGL
jgi:hypothetical protein